MTSNGTDLAMTSPSSPSTSEIPVIQTTTTDDIVVIKGRRYRQRQLGPAPFASFEDLSDELDSPPETARVTLPGIKEDPSSQVQSPSTPLPQVTAIALTEKEEQGLKDALKNSLVASGPPRIDISRASSSSQHEDSVTSSPDRENDTHNLGYKEDGTVDLRSSTEELDYIQEPGTVEESEERRKRERMLRRQQQVRNFGDTQSQHEFVERKDSSCSVMSDVGLLCISGRTSRLSSIGSAASGGSVASGASHLSIGSHLSGRSSRSPSPHKMLLETSFCGSKPMHSRSVEPEASPALVTLSEKSASRPPSSLRSRSPSPHKMLLETSFCGTKQISNVETQGAETPTKTPKKRKPKSATPTPTNLITEAEIVPEKSQITMQQAAPKPVEREKKIEKPKQEKPNEIKSLSKAVDAISAPGKPKTTLMFPRAEKKSSKPKKVISLRDLPVDEIYIPLKGPELDFEEIMCKASPNLKKKTEKTTADEIYIPLVSPTKSATGEQYAQSFPQEESTKVPVKSFAQKVKPEAKRSVAREKPQMKEYEVCEDGSIFIPLHSPDEDKRSKKYESDAHEDKKEDNTALGRDEEKQTKPETLDLYESASNATKWQSQTLTAARSEMISCGSRTPSPGSSLSRKSSFANLFRKSDVSGSPDSQSGSVRKKSGTLSTASRDTTEGTRDRSHSRSKSKERASASSGSHSSSGKKNVFTNLFGKKKAEVRESVSGRESENPPTKFDPRFMFNSGADAGGRKTGDEGDYIIIPLRDPSDPPGSLDMECVEPTSATERGEIKKASTPLADATDEAIPAKTVESTEIKEKPIPAQESVAPKSPNEESVEMGKEIVSVISSVGKEKGDSTKPSPELCSEDFFHGHRSKMSSNKAACQREEVEYSSVKTEKGKERDLPEGEDQNVEDDRVSGHTSLDKESILDADDKESREEVLTVTADGVRKLKLPPEPGDLEDDHERKGLVYQESFEDELPYVPTTLPQERSLGVPIVPVKQRVTEIKTCPIERPRSTTPINPTTLEDFVASKDLSATVSEDEKMKISLPREDSVTSKGKSPRRFSAKGKSWFEFAEEGLQSPRDYRKSSLRTSPSPPPLPPRSSPPSVLSSSAPPHTSSWINFEALPEKKKHPKRITTVPALKSSDDGCSASDKSGCPSGGNVVYNYVSPEDCQCECHDHNASSHHEEPHPKKGSRDVLSPHLEVNGDEYVMKDRPRKKVMMTQGGCVKSECKYCEVGKKSEEPETDVEERPLLGGNSDAENDEDSPSEKRLGGERLPNAEAEADRDEIRREPKLRREKRSPLSDSSSECGSHETGKTFGVADSGMVSSKPFEMDLHVDSNRSSLISQEDLVSPNGSDSNSDFH